MKKLLLTLLLLSSIISNITFGDEEKTPDSVPDPQGQIIQESPESLIDQGKLMDEVVKRLPGKVEWAFVSDDGTEEIVLTSFDCKLIGVPKSFSQSYRAYFATRDGVPKEGCWQHGDMTDAPVNAVMAINIWHDGQTETFAAPQFEPRIAKETTENPI